MGGGDAGVGGEAVEVVEARAGGPCGESGFAPASEMLLEAVEIQTGERIAGRNGAAGAGIAALEGDFADGKANDAAFVFAEELVFPEGRQLLSKRDPFRVDVDFESGAKAKANVVDGETRKPFGDGLERGCGNDGGAVGNGVVGEAPGRIANDYLLLEEHAEPLGGFFVFGGESERARRDFAAIGGDGKGDGTEVGRIVGADEMDRGSALAVNPLAVYGIQSPGAVKSESTGGRDAGFGDGDRVERLDGVEADVGKFGERCR